jgi:hypothetical protein
VAAATWRRNTELGAGGGRATGSTGLAGLFAAGIVGSPAAAGVSGSEGVFSGACPVGRVRRWMDSTFLVMSHPMLFPFLSFFFAGQASSFIHGCFDLNLYFPRSWRSANLPRSRGKVWAGID